MCILITSFYLSAAVNKAQTLAPYAGASPKLADNVFVAPNASVIGDVKIGTGSSIWYGAVLRGENTMKTNKSSLHLSNFNLLFRYYSTYN